MNVSDGELGMRAAISRRDFLNGVSLAVAGSMPAPELVRAFEQEFAPERAPDYYPPTRAGMRGSHEGSFEVAHQLRDRRRIDLSGALNTGETYDLVVVGGGLSGLAAAHYFIKEVGRGAKVLVLDNHDDFGVTPSDNEFSYNGRMLALNGGTLNIESPLRYNPPSRQLLQEVGIDLDSENRRRWRQLADDVSHRRVARRGGEPGRSAAPAVTGRADRASYDAVRRCSKRIEPCKRCCNGVPCRC